MKILFTGYNFDGYHGSMMLISEIAAYLKGQGHDIYIASLNLTAKIQKEITKMGLKIFSVEKLPENIEYDIIWAYHYPLLVYLLNKNIKYKKIVCGCLSGLLIPLETPNLLCYQNNIPILVNSEETKNKLTENYPSLTNQYRVLLNLVPDEFFSYAKAFLPEQQKKIAIVSNHVPKELGEAKKLLEKQGIIVDVYNGVDETKQNIKITPSVLSDYDTVITIGKTVQYSLALGIPVYNYDYMGGSGYINLENIDVEEFYNFSGRSFERKLTSKQLVEEILNGYKASLKDIKQLQEIAKERYLLSKNVDKVIQEIENLPNTIIEQTEQWDLYSKQISYLLGEILVCKTGGKNANLYRKIRFHLLNYFPCEFRIVVINIEKFAYKILNRICFNRLKKF